MLGRLRDRPAFAVADERAARHRHHSAIRQAIERLDEIGLFLSAVEQGAGPHAHGKSAEGFAMRNLKTQIAGPVFALEGDGIAAWVQHHDRQRFHAFFPSCRQRGRNDLTGRL